MLRYAILGLVQGVTEFLPVSSSGHLVILQHFFGLEAETSTLLDALLHFGTLLAVLVLFRKRIWKLIASIFGNSSENRRYLSNIILATVPIAVAGFLAQDIIESAFNSLRAAGIGLLVTSLVLAGIKYLGETTKGMKSLTWKDSLIVGIVQTAALFPGVSRSGVTISAGMVRKLNPEFAAEFSFLLMVPAVFGATLFKVWDGIISNPAPISSQLALPYIVGTIISALSGALAIVWLIRLLKKGRFSFFAYYCFAVGATVVTWSFL
ncbi:MAG: undecaprenyl-diphosphatase UppP [Candidatus Acetothermia bacterium]